MYKITSEFVLSIWHLIYRKHDCLLLLQTHAIHIKIIVSEVIYMDLFMRPRCKQAANVLIHHTFPGSRTINSNHPSRLFVCLGSEGKQWLLFHPEGHVPGSHLKSQAAVQSQLSVIEHGQASVIQSVHMTFSVSFCSYIIVIIWLLMKPTVKHRIRPVTVGSLCRCWRSQKLHAAHQFVCF